MYDAYSYENRSRSVKNILRGRRTRPAIDAVVVGNGLPGRSLEPPYHLDLFDANHLPFRWSNMRKPHGDRPGLAGHGPARGVDDVLANVGHMGRNDTMTPLGSVRGCFLLLPAACCFLLGLFFHREDEGDKCTC
jgi:hypothetical protein